MSIFREEAIDTLISCLRNTDFPSVQIVAAETIVSLQGRFSIFGKPLTRAILLKRAGLEKKYRAVMRQEKLGNIPTDSNESSVSFLKTQSNFHLSALKSCLAPHSISSYLSSSIKHRCSFSYLIFTPENKDDCLCIHHIQIL